MGGFFLATKREGDRAAIMADRARHQFRLSGLGEPVRVDDPAYVLDYYPKHGQSVGSLVRFGECDFMAAVGTIIYGNRHGADALRLIARAPDQKVAVNECRGHFALLVRRAGQTSLLRDSLGIYEVYHDEDLRILSTSFLALAHSLPRHTIGVAECVEYVINGLTYGIGTPIQEIRRLDLGDAVTFDPRPRIAHRKAAVLPKQSSARFDDQLELVLSALRASTESVVEAFDRRVKLSFSGGYDSRLMLALLLARAVEPSLFVYGAGPNSGDPPVAKAVAAGESLRLEYVKKELLRPVTLEAFPEMARRNFNWNDGYSQFGIFFSDAESVLRAERSRPPEVVLMGAAGEMFRNFLKFNGRRLAVRDFVRVVLGQSDPQILTAPLLRTLFEDNLTRKITALLELDKPELDRRQVEALYPYLRSHAWHGRGVSIDNRFGNIVMPYSDRQVVEAVLGLPAKWKNFGNFESRMIREINPRLAAYRSAYGFSFDRRTPLRGMRSELFLYALPPAARQYNYRIKRRIFRQPSRRLELTETFLATVIDTKFPIMSRLFNVRNVADNAQLDRIATLEYMFESLNAEVQQRELVEVH